MSTEHPGYLIPENVQPDGYYCLRVYIPRDVAYLYAFSGAFQFFGKWPAWRRDSGHNATLAAAAWRDAIAYTFENGWLNCGEDDVCEHCDLIPVILERLEELTNMNINVNCGCGCGCQDSQTAPAPPNPGSPTQPPAEIPVPPSDPAALAWRCNAAYYLTDKFGQQLQYDNSGGNRPSYEEWNDILEGAFFALYPGFILVNELVYFAYAALAGWIWGVFGGNQVTTALATYRDAFACAIYTANDDDQARRQFNGVIDQAFSFSTTLRWASKALTAVLPFGMPFSPLTTGIPGYSGMSCCGGSGGSSAPVPPAVAGYAWLPISPEHLSFDSHSTDGSLLEQLGLGHITHGFSGGLVGSTNYEVVTANVLNDARLPSVGASIAAFAAFLDTFSFTGTFGSPFDIWEFDTYGIDWFLGAPATPTPPDSMLAYDAAHATPLAGIIGSFAHSGSPDTFNTFAIDKQGGGATPHSMQSKCYCYWLVEL